MRRATSSPSTLPPGQAVFQGGTPGPRAPQHESGGPTLHHDAPPPPTTAPVTKQRTTATIEGGVHRPPAKGAFRPGVPAEPAAAPTPRRATVEVNPKSLQAVPQPVAQDDTGALAPGCKVSHEKAFDVIEIVGEGGMGKVYRAYDPVMDRYVALKVLKLDVPETERRRFRREAVIAANFSHPNLPRVLDRGGNPDQGLEWMTMEYLRGRDLGRIIDLGREIAFPLLIDIFVQALDALDYIHTRRIVHCDVKPDNIFVTRDSYDRRIVIVKLIDFGVCRSLDAREQPSKQLIGDPRYMAPEQTIVGGPICPQTDLYALGLTFYEAVTGAHPFDAEIQARSTKHLLKIQRRVMPSPVKDRKPEIPTPIAVAIDQVISLACAKDPARRYPDAKAMKRGMQGLLDNYSRSH